MAGVPKVLFDQGGVPPHDATYFSYAVTADGQKFLTTARLEVSSGREPESSPIVVVFNWLAGVTK